MLTRFMAMLLINSEEPLVQALKMTLPSRRHLPRRSRLLFFRPK